MLVQKVELESSHADRIFSRIRPYQRKHHHIVETPTRETLPLPMTAAILAGGQSLRMGQAKAFLPIYGSTFIEHQINILDNLFSDLFLVANNPEQYTQLDVAIVKDIIPNKGPLVGILSALLASQYDFVFVLACDMPLIDRRLIRDMVSQRHDSDVLVLAHENGVEPLVGVYSKNCIGPLEEAVFAGKRKAMDFLEGVKAKTYKLPSSANNGLCLPPYYNINTPGEYSQLLSLAGA